MPSLLDLSLEIQEMIVLKLESVEDVISLGSSCRDLARTVGQERIWRGIFSKTEELVDNRWTWNQIIRKDLFRRITTFLTSLDNREAIFSLLHQTIYDSFPASGQGRMEENITVSCPSSPQLHSVSGLGLELLALSDREGARHTVRKIKMGRISPSLLLSLASLQRDQVTELEGDSVRCNTEEEGSALVSLLESSTTWKVGMLQLSGEVGGQTWEGLGREVARGTLGVVMATREVVRSGRREDLRAVWQKTEEVWWVDGEDIWKSYGEEEGWRKIEQMIQ